MAVDPIKIQTVLRKASDQQLMALLKRPDSIPSMFVQQEIRRRNQARQAAKADMSKMAMAQRPQLTPEMSRMDQTPMPRPQDPMASAIPMNTGGSGELAKQKQLLMQMYNAGRMNIVQGVAQRDKGELGSFARSLLGGASYPEEAMGLNIQGARPYADNNKSEFLNQLEQSGIKAIQSETTPMDLENEFIEGQFDPEGKFDYGGSRASTDPRMRTNTIGFDPRTNIGEMRFPPNYASRENLVEPETNIDAVRPNILPSTVLDRRAIPRGPDFADQKFQQKRPSGMLETDAQLNIDRPSTLSNIIDAFNNPVPDSGRYLATNRGDLDQARNLIQGEVGFGDISSTSGLEIPESSGKLPISDIFKGIANIGGEPSTPVSQGGINSDRFLMQNDVMTPEYMDYLTKRNRANKKVADSIQTDNALFTEKGFVPATPSGSASYLPDDRRIIAEGPDYAYKKFERGMPTGNFEQKGYAQPPKFPDGSSRSLDAYNIIKDEIAEGLDNEFLGSTIFKSPGDIRDVRKNILGLGAGTDQDKFKSGGNFKDIFTPLPTVAEVTEVKKKFNPKSDRKEIAELDSIMKDAEKNSEIVESINNDATKVFDYSTPEKNQEEYEKASASDKAIYNNKAKKTGVGDPGGVGSALASQYGNLTDAQNKLIEAMKPNGGDRFWQLVAEFGANLAASDSPNFMQAA
ncbi:MAG: hypothetical protein CMA48_01375, partial [Euryarchaeota archaeon]|nr:hypothetical protein [Euryarchaeota archaeon]